MDNPEKTIIPAPPATSVTPASTNNLNSATSTNNKKNKKNRSSKKESVVSAALAAAVSPAAILPGLKEKIENEAVQEVKPTPVPPVVPTPTSTTTITTTTSEPLSRSSPPAAGNQRLPAKGRAARREEKSEMTSSSVAVSSPKKNGSQQQSSNNRHSGAAGANASANSGRNPAGPAVGETGWKEVVRKSKKVSVPAHAISRVIGRGGCNINAIRELSGAHIEVEKQGQKMGSERSISIKGSAEATRQAHAWIQAIISCPDKDIADIVGKQQLKILQQSQSSGQQPVVQPQQLQQQTLVISNSNAKETVTSKSPTFNTTAYNVATAATTVTAAPAAPAAKSGGKGNQQQQNQATKSAATNASGTNKKGSSNAASNLPTGKASNSIPAFATAKPASSFAAVASGSPATTDNFAGMMIQTGTHPGSLKNKQRPVSAIVETAAAGKESGGSNSSTPAPAVTPSGKQHHGTSAQAHQQLQQPQTPQSSQSEKKSEYSPFTSSSPTSDNQPSSASSTAGSSAKIASDFSPFRSIKMSWAVKEESENKNFARVAASGLPPPTIPMPPSSMAVQVFNVIKLFIFVNDGVAD